MADSKEQEANFAAKLIAKISENEEFCDLKIKLGEEHVLANKTILAMVCPKFTDIFNDVIRKSQINLVNESEERKENLKLVLEFIYKGFINTDDLSDDQVIDIYAMSLEFKFSELTDFVTQTLNNIDVTSENVGKLFDVAFKNEQRSKETGESSKNSLLQKCWQFLDNNSETIIESPEVFESFSYDLVLEIVKRDTFYAKEIDIFDAVVNWGERHNKGVKDILQHLRFKYISAEEISKHILQTKVISGDDYFKAVTQSTQDKRVKQRQPPIMLRRHIIPRNSSLDSMNVPNTIAIEKLGGLLCNEFLSDVTFSFQDDEIHAHRVILGAACPYFKELFKEVLQCIPSDREELIFDVQPKLFHIMLDFIYGKAISLSSLSEDEMIELFWASKSLNCTPLIELVGKRLQAVSVDEKNVGKLYRLASDNNLSSLKDKCDVFIRNNAQAIINCKDVFVTLPKELIEKIVRPKIYENVFEALTEWKAHNGNIDISDILSTLPLKTISPEKFAQTILPTGLIKMEQYFEAHLNNQMSDVSIINTLCKTHPSGVCRASIRKIFSRHLNNIISNEIDFEGIYRFRNEGELIVVEFHEICQINTIEFTLCTNSLYAYEVKAGIKKEVMEFIKPYSPGRYYTLHQKLTFPPKQVKYVQISSIQDEPLELRLESIKAMYDFGLNGDCSGLRDECDLVASIPIDVKLKQKFHLFNVGDDEMVYVLRYPCKVSTVGIQLYQPLGSKMELFVKETANSDWQLRAVAPNLGLSTVIVIKESSVSFIKLKGDDIKSKVQVVECPATAQSFPLRI